MRWQEIQESASVGAVSASNMASVSQPLLTQSRSDTVPTPAKYTVDAAPNTPQEIKRFKQNAVGRFKNSIGH